MRLGPDKHARRTAVDSNDVKYRAARSPRQSSLRIDRPTVLLAEYSVHAMAVDHEEAAMTSLDLLQKTMYTGRGTKVRSMEGEQLG